MQMAKTGPYPLIKRQKRWDKAGRSLIESDAIFSALISNLPGNAADKAEYINGLCDVLKIPRRAFRAKLRTHLHRSTAVN